MPRSRLRLVVALWPLAALARESFAQDLCLPPPDPALLAPVSAAEPAPDEPAQTPDAPPQAPADDTIELTVGSFDIGAGADAQFSNQVEIHYRDAQISAERATVENGNVEVLGSVTLTAPDVKVYGEDARVDRDSETISFGSAGFDLPKRTARGSAEQILIRNDNTVSLSNVLFTTCPVDKVDWELRARDIHFDTAGGVGTARGIKLNFKGVPILYAPFFSFPIDNQRKSGFLTPNITQRDRTGLDISVPYYLNLAPNYDLTLEPRYMSKRGVQLRSDFRYLTPRSEGQFGFEYLPNDDRLGETRRYLTLDHQSSFGPRWELVAGIEDVSDDIYFEDLGSSLAVTSQTHLDRFVDLRYFATNWSLLSRVQNYQTIDPVLTDVERPYERLPQLLYSGEWIGRRLGFNSNVELVNFDRNVGVTGWRLDSEQEFSVRFARAGMYLTPAVALRHTGYWLDGTAAGADDTPTRSLPIASLDSGLTFERPAGRGGRFVQTLEPRLLLVRVPYEDQTDLPVFDTVLPDFNLVQLFRKYQYVGRDRVTDTDRASFGVTTRLIDGATGRERLAATFGQTRYLNAQRVSLPGVPPITTQASDYIAELALGWRDAWNLNVGYQWNTDTDSTQRVETRFEYRPQVDRLFGFGYRYRPGLLEQGDLSVVWPAADRWRVIGSYSYSFLDDEPLEQFLGWEYDSCCWRFRVVGRQYVSRRTGETDSSISIQLELKGLSQGGSTPEELLDRGILGYRSIATSRN